MLAAKVNTRRGLVWFREDLTGNSSLACSEYSDVSCGSTKRG